jgi:hypothetical protein
MARGRDGVALEHRRESVRGSVELPAAEQLLHPAKIPRHDPRVDELEAGRDLLDVVEGRTVDLGGVAFEPADAGPVEPHLVGAEQKADRERVLDVDLLQLAGARSASAVSPVRIAR